LDLNSEGIAYSKMMITSFVPRQKKQAANNEAPNDQTVVQKFQEEVY
jgi:hypothetical protein